MKYNFRLLLHFLLHRSHYINQPTYYPECKHKSKLTITKEFITHILKYGEIEDNYYAYGLDVIGTNPEDYIPYQEYMKIRDTYNGFNRLGSEKVNYACLLRDKKLFEIMALHYSLPTVYTLGFYKEGIVSTKEEDISFSDFIKSHPSLFLKPADTMKGAHTFAVESQNSIYYLNEKSCTLDEIQTKLNEVKTPLMVQPRLKQHYEMNRLYGKSINTIRIATVLSQGEVLVVGQFLRLGGHGSIVDNMSTGGLGVGINKDGTLQKYGFLHKTFGTKIIKHPDTNIEFSTFKIPFFKEAVDLVKQAHLKFYQIPAVGWDVCITPDGPIIIEGNDNFGGIGLQTICGGKAHLFRKIFNGSPF